MFLTSALTTTEGQFALYHVQYKSNGATGESPQKAMVMKGLKHLLIWGKAERAGTG